MAKARLGDLLIRAGVISESQLRVALAQQRQHGGRIGEHLVRVNLVTEQQIAIAVADQLGLVYNDCKHAHAAQFSSMVPHKVAEQLQALPVRFEPQTDTLHVAVADPLDEQVPMQLARLTGKRIELEVAPKALLRQVIKMAYADIELHDEGTNEFQLVDSFGRSGAVVKVQTGANDELPEASVLEMDPISDSALHGAPTPLPGSLPRRIEPPPPAARASTDSGEEALRLFWALADILVEKGYLSRSDLMAKLRGK